MRELLANDPAANDTHMNTSTTKLKTKIRNLCQQQASIDSPIYHHKSSLSRLCAIGNNIEVDLCDNTELQFFSKKYDIHNMLHTEYDANGKRTTNKALCKHGMRIFATLLYLRVIMSEVSRVTKSRKLSFINVCYKAFEHIDKTEFTRISQLDEILERTINQTCEHPQTGKYNNVYSHCPDNNQKHSTLPLDILFYEGPIARAYLETIYSIGYKPRRIIKLIPQNDIITKKPVGRFLPTSLRVRYAERIQSQKIHYWSRYFLSNHTTACQNIFRDIKKSLGIHTSAIERANQLRPLQQYCDHITPLLISSLKDPRLSDFLNQKNKSLYLFTGGGIMPKNLFDHGANEFLHIHPGHLPEIRGADCLLWSMILHNQPSATCFYMAPGIDTGDIIHATYLPRIPLPKEITSLDDKMIYRFLYCYVDPWVRAAVLRDTLVKTNQFMNTTSSPQKITQGHTFHFMQQRLRASAIMKFIK